MAIKYIYVMFDVMTVLIVVVYILQITGPQSEVIVDLLRIYEEKFICQRKK